MKADPAGVTFLNALAFVLGLALCVGAGVADSALYWTHPEMTARQVMLTYPGTLAGYAALELLGALLAAVGWVCLTRRG